MEGVWVDFGDSWVDALIFLYRIWRVLGRFLLVYFRGFRVGYKVLGRLLGIFLRVMGCLCLSSLVGFGGF